METKNQCKKNACKTKRTLYQQRLKETLSRMPVFTDFFINMILFIYTPAILGDFG